MTLTLSIILILISAVLSGYLVYLCLRPRLFATQEVDQKVREENEQERQIQIQLKESNSLLKEQTSQLKNEYSVIETKKNLTLDQIKDLTNNISQLEQQAQTAADSFYNSKMEIAQNKFENAIEEARQNYLANVESFNNQYNESVATLMETFKELSENFATLKANNDAAIEAAKRAEQMRDQLDYYRIQLAPADIEEIQLLREIAPKLRDKEPLNKVIWKCYYEKPTASLVGRVVGPGVKTGIYKITEIETGKCYVGQASSLSARWIQHIKRGLGAETPTKNKLYPAMQAIGPENFTFEIIEECPRNKLDEREDFWQEYYQAREFGYSIK